MLGTMLWFNVDKGYGFIRTEDEERLYVDGADFLPEHEPGPRCKGRQVSFERRVVDDDARAVAVCYVESAEPRRARLRSARSGRAL